MQYIKDIIVIITNKQSMYTVIYQLIAAATITFSKQKGAATKRGQLLYEGGH